MFFRHTTHAVGPRAIGLVALLTAFIAVGAGTALAAAPLPVGLGTADSFAILAGSDITNVPTSTISGNVGLSPGTSAANGLTCAQVSGTIYKVDPAGPACFVQDAPLISTAKGGANSAYDNIFAQAGNATADATLVNLGGRSLTAGVYKSGGVLGINAGTLTLNGQGDPDALFIFHSDSTLITAVGTQVQLINDAQACNVFWQVDSAANLGGGSTFVGTILAHDKITVDGSTTVAGRLIAGVKATDEVTLISDTITRPSSCINGAAVAAANAAAAAAAAATAATAAAAAAATLAAQVDAAAVTALAATAAKAAETAAAAAKAAVDAALVAKTAKAAAAAKAAKIAAAKAAVAKRAAKKARLALTTARAIARRRLARAGGSPRPRFTG